MGVSIGPGAVLKHGAQDQVLQYTDLTELPGHSPAGLKSSIPAQTNGKSLGSHTFTVSTRVSTLCHLLINCEWLLICFITLSGRYTHIFNPLEPHWCIDFFQTSHLLAMSQQSEPFVSPNLGC